MNNLHFCRNAKSSQEVVDFVKVRLLEDKGHSEETQRLTTICEAVSHIRSAVHD